MFVLGLYYYYYWGLAPIPWLPPPLDTTIPQALEELSSADPVCTKIHYKLYEDP